MEDEQNLPKQDSRNVNYVPKDSSPFSGQGYRLGGDENPPKKYQYEKFEDDS